MIGAFFEIILTFFSHKLSGKNKIVIGVIIILIFSLSIYLGSNKYENQKKRNTANEMSVIEENILSFKKERGRLPYDLKELTGSNPLKREWLFDSWGNAYRYEIKDSVKYFFVLSSNGANSHETEDDMIVINSSDSL